jgi:hypothetical protein
MENIEDQDTIINDLIRDDVRRDDQLASFVILISPSPNFGEIPQQMNAVSNSLTQRAGGDEAYLLPPINDDSRESIVRPLRPLNARHLFSE